MSSTVFASNQNGDLPADVTILTTSVDTVLASDVDQEVRATAATLTPSTTNYATIPSTVTPGDALEGGAGHDVLSLTGAGSFNLAGLTKFSGFEEVRLTNVTNSTAFLTLRDGADLAVTLSDGTTPPTTTPPYTYPSTTGGIAVTLGTGKVVLHGATRATRSRSPRRASSWPATSSTGARVATRSACPSTLRTWSAEASPPIPRRALSPTRRRSTATRSTT